jgi:hypothetical protein
MAAVHPIAPFDELTNYPTARWIRATRGGDTIVGTRQALDRRDRASSHLAGRCRTASVGSKVPSIPNRWVRCRLAS